MTPPCRPSRGPISLRLSLVTAALAFLTAAAASAQLYPPTLTYSDLKDRNEGLVGEPRTEEAALTLMSALAIVGPVEDYTRWPDTLRLRFFLPKGEEGASVAVRQVPAPNGFYRLDKVRPGKPWAAGATNDFAWPTARVARIFDFQAPSQPGVTRAQWVAQLGVVVTVGPPDAGGRRATVAPATLFHTRQPGAVSAYDFTFRSTVSAEIREVVASEATRRPTPLTPRAVDANSPFTTRWVPGGSPEGWYQLTSDVAFKGPSAGPAQQWVFRFYHRPTLRP